MSGRANSRRLRAISAFVLVSFTSSLAAPLVRAEVDTQAVAATATQNAKVALSDLWGAWVKQGGSSSIKPDRTFAFSFFTKAGATSDQANVLTNNAQAAGQLSTPLPASSSGITGWLKSKFGIGQQAPVPKSLAAAPEDSAAAAAPTGFFGKIKSMLGFGSSTPAASDAQAAAVAGTQPAGAWGDDVHNGLNKLGGAVNGVALKAKGVVHDVTGGVTTAVLTAGDKLDLRQFYTIPVTDTSAVKITGGSAYTVKFTNNGWVNQQVKSNVNLVDAINKNEAMGQIDKLDTAAGPAEATSGPLASFIGKFKSGLASLKAKITGKPALSDADNAELSTKNVQSNLLEQAQGLNQAQSAIQVRITKLQTDAVKLGRPEPTEEIANLQRTSDSIEAQKKDVISKLQESDKGGIFSGNTLNAGMKWAAYSVGIQAGVNIIGQVVNGQKVDFKNALSFMGQPSFWAGTAGSFLGSLVLTNVASALIPGGGIFMKVLPGFLGAALGYQVGAGFFGGGSGDWIGTIGSTLASAGAYSLAYTFLGGAGAPALALIAAGIAGGALFNFLWNKIHGNPAAISAGKGAPPPDLGTPLPDPQANGAAAGVPGAVGAAAGQGTHASPIGAGNLDALNKSMQQAYADYINDLKDQKVTDARAAFDRYTQAKTQLDALRASASSTATQAPQGQ